MRSATLTTPVGADFRAPWFSSGAAVALPTSIDAGVPSAVFAYFYVGDQAVTVAQATPGNSVELARIQAYLDTQYTAKDVRHTFETKLGQNVDCIDFFSHPSVKAEAALGRPITKMPSPPPTPPGASKEDTVPDWAFDGQPDKEGRKRKCPEGSVPMIRVTVAEILALGGLDTYLRAQSTPLSAESNWRYSHVRERYNYNQGNPAPIIYGESSLSVTKPLLTPAGGSPHAVTQGWMISGTDYGNDGNSCSPPNCLQTVEAGWWVTRDGPDPRFILFATNNGYGYPNCPPAPQGCPNWVPYGTFQNGALLPYNVAGSPWTQPDLHVIVENYNSNWWVWAAGNWIGYYPGANFFGTMQNSATRFDTGAEAYEDYYAPNPGFVKMGTGVTAGAGLGQSGYVHDYWVYLTPGGWSNDFNADKSDGVDVYDYSTSTPGAPNWANHMFFGNTQPMGTYGSCSQCTWNASKLECECPNSILGIVEDSVVNLPCVDGAGIVSCNGQLACGSCSARPGGSYWASCTSCSWSSKFLKCNCNKGGGSYQWSTLGLPCNNNDDIYNSYGTLTCPNRPAIPGGSYNSSCKNCSWTSSSLQCECSNNISNWMTSSVALPCPSGVDNNNGQLVCNGNPAPPSGSYANSCRNCTWSNQSLQCQCQTGTGVWVLASLALPCGSVVNCNGGLRCGGC